MTPKQKMFVQEYLIDLDQTKAAIRAGFSAATAAQIGHALVGLPAVANAISLARARRAARLEVKADRVLEELCKIAFADRAGIAQVKNGRVKVADTASLNDDQRAALAEVSQGKNGISVKLENKLEALKLIGQHLGMFPNKVEHGGRIGTYQLTDEQLAVIAAGGGPGAAATPPGSG